MTVNKVAFLRVCGMVTTLLAGFFSTNTGLAQSFSEADVDKRQEGVGQFARLVIRGGFLIDGTGAPPKGPVDIVVGRDRIIEVKVVGVPGVPINPKNRPATGDYEINAEGKYILPGFIDLHGHVHSLDAGQNVPPDYIFKLWLAHGITTIRELGNDRPVEWMLDLQRRSAANIISAPRLHVYPRFRANEEYSLDTPQDARTFITKIAQMGVDGVKFFGDPPEVLWAALDEAQKHGLKTTMHHGQLSVTHANVLDTSERGLDTMEHWYGLPEAMFTGQKIQHYPAHYIYQNEQDRFREAGRLWKQAAVSGSQKWKEVAKLLLDRDFAIVPTMTAYLTSRDFMRMSRATWHADYTLPSLWDWFRPTREAHGSYWFYWTTEDETAWKENYHLWMKFLNDFKNSGGKVGVGSDSGYIYNLYGFGYVQELELLREAGFHPLEVLHSATLMGAQILGVDNNVGSVQVGKKADLLIVGENPVENLKVLFGTGTIRLNDVTGETERVGGIEWTIKDGIVYNAAQLRADVRKMVKAQKNERGIPEGIMPVATRDMTRIVEKEN
ncbi:amidohydrolase family protein [Paremcibacter congregatus]|uniref:amidohydrolase family protein n=1 Tax=Paremcibacter congregatus TaxID=2043170 RepID=UPI003A915490